MKKVKIGVVGMGSRGRAVAQVAADFDQVEFVAACDRFAHNWYKPQWFCETPMAEQFPNTAFYEDYDEMLEKADIDTVIVETGADVHAEFCIKALNKNLNVFTDIPCVANLKEAEDMWNAALKSKGQIYVGANPNYQKFTYFLKDFYNKGLLGKPYYMEGEYIHWCDPDAPANIHLSENGNWRKLLAPIRYCTHSLGPLLTILDEDLRTVSCFGTGRHAPEDDPSYEFDGENDMMCAQFQTESGVVVRFMKNGRCRAEIGHHNYRVFGTEGYMERIDRFFKPVIRYRSTKELVSRLKEISGEFMPPKYADHPKAKDAGHDGMDFAMLDNLFKKLSEGEGEIVTLKEGLAMTLPGIYAEESAKRGGEVITMYYPWDKEWSTEFR